MSAHFKWYPSSEEVVVPWNARYSYPSQANKAIKITPRIPPKNGSSFTPGSIIRLEFPAQGYVNPINTTLEFDVTMTATAAAGYARFQNNIQSIFTRVRLMYGSTPLEDIINYNQIVRNLTEWTASGAQNTIDQVSISEGVGNVTQGQNCANAAVALDPTAGLTVGLVNVRQKFIQGLDFAGDGTNTLGCREVPNSVSADGATVTAYNCTRRYQVNLALGLLTQSKLIPTKFMASQLAIEITLDSAADCIFSTLSTANYSVQNVNLIPEILEFDSSYDAMFLKGLQDGGVPIKFASWHTFLFGTGGASALNLQIQERSRSVKALFACMQLSTPVLTLDTGATLFNSNAAGSMINYQYRIGGRYFPGQPVELSINGGAICNGGAEAYVELQKAMNVVGDYRLSTGCNTIRWAHSGFGIATDFQTNLVGFSTLNVPVVSSALAETLTLGGNLGSQCYTSSIDLETSNGVEISGLNAEEQSDIAFIARWTNAQSSSYVINVFTYYDSMLILRENNVMELIQ